MMSRLTLQYVTIKTVMKLLAANPRKTLSRLAYPIGKLWYALDWQHRGIETYIRMAPDNWLWVHRRWRIINIPESHRRKFDTAVERYPHAFRGASSDDPYGSDQ